MIASLTMVQPKRSMRRSTIKQRKPSVVKDHSYRYPNLRSYPYREILRNPSGVSPKYPSFFWATAVRVKDGGKDTFTNEVITGHWGVVSESSACYVVFQEERTPYCCDGIRRRVHKKFITDYSFKRPFIPPYFRDPNVVIDPTVPYGLHSGYQPIPSRFIPK